tara:strand:+ start:44 stop:571 length:528 start_codon:yes stop_codon:yes gene_type:complete
MESKSEEKEEGEQKECKGEGSTGGTCSARERQRTGWYDDAVRREEDERVLRAIERQREIERKYESMNELRRAEAFEAGERHGRRPSEIGQNYRDALPRFHPLLQNTDTDTGQDYERFDSSGDELTYLGSKLHGGVIYKTGLYKLHAGELVLNPQQHEKYNKMRRKNMSVFGLNFD